MSQAKKIYSSSDFLTVSTLVLRKHKLIKVDRSSRRAVFLFEDTSRLQDDKKQLEAGTLLVSPLDFWVAERQCKRLIYGEEQP